MEAIHTGVMVINAETQRIVDINPYALQMIGAPREEVVEQHYRQYVVRRDRRRPHYNG